MSTRVECTPDSEPFRNNLLQRFDQIAYNNTYPSIYKSFLPNVSEQWTLSIWLKMIWYKIKRIIKLKESETTRFRRISWRNTVDSYFSFFSSLISDGKCLACTYRAKFVEVSVGIHHNVDELLAGTLTQIRLKKEQNALQVSENLAYSFCLDLNCEFIAIMIKFPKIIQ